MREAGGRRATSEAGCLLRTTDFSVSGVRSTSHGLWRPIKNDFGPFVEGDGDRCLHPSPEVLKVSFLRCPFRRLLGDDIHLEIMLFQSHRERRSALTQGNETGLHIDNRTNSNIME